jgi:ribosomal-protein-serine acetyltransferase
MTAITPEIIPVSAHLELRAVEESHAPELHKLVVKNRAWLQQSLDWPQYVGSEEDSLKNIQGNQMLHQRGYAKMFLIFLDNALVGVISFNAIEPLNKTGYIGYWLDESHQGQGILSQALQRFIRYYVERKEIRRFVIKCRAANEASNRVALKNGFELEGRLKQAEFLNGHYDDQNIYARIDDL